MIRMVGGCEPDLGTGRRVLGIGASQIGHGTRLGTILETTTRRLEDLVVHHGHDEQRYVEGATRRVDQIALLLRQLARRALVELFGPIVPADQRRNGYDRRQYPHHPDGSAHSTHGTLLSIVNWIVYGPVTVLGRKKTQKKINSN